MALSCNASEWRLFHTFLKTLLSNACSNDCRYCSLRSESSGAAVHFSLKKLQIFLWNI